jgi:hypothetical protein
MKEILRLFSTVMAFVLFCSCASVPGAGDRSTENLRVRVEAFYKAKMDSDFREAFQYEHMSLDEQFTVQFYMSNAAKSPMQFQEATIVSINVDETGDSALVKMHLKYKLMQMQHFEKFGQMEQTIEEKWVYKNNNWYHIIKGLTKEW